MGSALLLVPLTYFSVATLAARIHQMTQSPMLFFLRPSEW